MWNLRNYVRGFAVSIPVFGIALLGFYSNLNNIFWPLTIVAALISLPGNFICMLVLGILTLPFIEQFGVNGYVWLMWLFYIGIFFGAHLNGMYFLRPNLKAKASDSQAS